MVLLQVLFALEKTIELQEKSLRRTQTMAANEAIVEHYNCGDLHSVLFEKNTVRVSRNSPGSYT